MQTAEHIVYSRCCFLFDATAIWYYMKMVCRLLSQPTSHSKKKNDSKNSKGIEVNRKKPTRLEIYIHTIDIVAFTERQIHASWNWVRRGADCVFHYFSFPFLKSLIWIQDTAWEDILLIYWAEYSCSLHFNETSYYMVKVLLSVAGSV